MRRIRTLIAGTLVVPALVLFALAGCASMPNAIGGTGPAPTAACPSPAEGPAPTTCAAYDGEKSMRQNNAYKIRNPLDATEQKRLDTYVGPVKAGLAKLAASGKPITAASITTVLAGNGLTDGVQSTGNPPSIAFAVENGNGCIFGAVTGTKVDVAAGGFVPDGGCLVINGH